MKNTYTLAEQVRDTIKVHGIRWAATYYSTRMTFTHFHYMAFGTLPRVIHANGRLIHCI